MKRFALFFIAALLFVIIGCTSPTDEESESIPTGVTLSLNAVPMTLAANGRSEAIIFCEVQRNGDWIADSTQVLLFQTLGRLKCGTALTSQGVALDTLVSDTLSGICQVIAYVEGQRDTVEIIFIAP
ncbi:hypothetical protein KKB28_05165 [bacterium]|nr:hypothetical protein [bacterium]